MSTQQLAEARGEKARPRAGRPPKGLAGAVDTRILEAARLVFLERGLGGASIDEIAARAGAGKPTIYARFPGKEALFAAVVMREVEGKVARVESALRGEGGLEARLVEMAGQILERGLTSETVDLMRLAIAESQRFPDLASGVHGMACERSAEAVARLLDEAVRADGEFRALPAFGPERLAATARFLLDMIFTPLIFEALFGEKLEVLRARIPEHAARSVGMFLAGCRAGAMG